MSQCIPPTTGHTYVGPYCVPRVSYYSCEQKAKLAYMTALGMAYFQTPAVMADQRLQLSDFAATFDHRKNRIHGSAPVAVRGTSSKHKLTEQELTEQAAEKHDDTCARCGHGGELLMCESCALVFHLPCLEPPLYAVPEGQWFCPRCSIIEHERELVMGAYACGSLATILHSFEAKWLQLQTLTTSEIQALEVRNAALVAQQAELKAALKDTEDQASALQSQVLLLGKHQSQTVHALTQLQSTSQLLLGICNS